MKKDFGFLQKLVRLYTFYSPLRKGKYRLAVAALNSAKDAPDEILAFARDRRKLLVNPTSLSYRFIYFLGEYEPSITRVISQIVKPGDVCLDVGANIGWYTTLLQKLVGDGGAVHAFEPVQNVYEKLCRNVSLNEPPTNVMINNLALGNTEKIVELHIFTNLPEGHHSIATFDNNEDEYESFPCRMTMLDSYLSENEIGEVNFVKMDIEGAEMMMLEGANKLFNQKRPPIWEIEMALDTTRGFDYLPNDLIEYMRRKADYEFYVIDETNFGLHRIEGFSPDDKGANVLCFPNGYYPDRLAQLRLKT